LKPWLRWWYLHAWPRAPEEDEFNPGSIFETYKRVLADLGAEQHPVKDTELLQVTRQLFEDEAQRRESIDARAGLLFGATGISGSLIVGVAPGLLRIVPHATVAPLSYEILACYLPALVFFGRTIVNAIRVQGSIRGYTLGPDDLLPSENAEISYERSLALKTLWYTIENYKVNNRQLQLLLVAQQCFRNAVILVLLAGLGTPFR
jgi:hypothetical protein